MLLDIHWKTILTNGKTLDLKRSTQELNQKRDTRKYKMFNMYVRFDRYHISMSPAPALRTALTMP